MDKKEVVFSIVLILTGIAGFVYSLLLPPMGPIALSPGLFPGFVTLLMIVLGTVWLIQLFLKRTEADKEETEENRSIFITVGLFLLYLLLLMYVHFIVSTFIFLFTAMLYLYKKFYWKIPVISAATAAGVFVLFRYLLNVRLP